LFSDCILVSSARSDGLSYAFRQWNAPLAGGAKHIDVK
jgi:hypothetical protein